MQCAIAGCGGAVPDGAPLALCTEHLRVAYEWVALGEGAIDALPSPCPACGSRLGVRLPSAWVCAICEWRYGDRPDGETPDRRLDVVYYVRWGDRIKIGTTGNPRQRFAALRVADVMAFERGDRALERRRHDQFDALRFPGSEWFRAEEPLLAHIDAVAAGRDPWQLYERWVSERIARG
jgi:hypothetical protein